MLMKPLNNLENTFLDDLIQNQRFISVYLKNGIRLKGYMIGHDAEALFLRNGTIPQLIYKHSVSTLSPETFNPHS
jgi:host factor-I protein